MYFYIYWNSSGAHHYELLEKGLSVTSDIGCLIFIDANWLWLLISIAPTTIEQRKGRRSSQNARSDEKRLSELNFDAVLTHPIAPTWRKRIFIYSASYSISSLIKC